MFSKVYTNKDIRKALECYSLCKSFRKAEKRCGIGKSTIQRWWQTFHSYSVRTKIQRKKTKHHRRLKYPDLLLNVQNLFDMSGSFTTLKSVASCLPSQPSISWLHHCLKKLKIKRKRFVSTKVNTKSDLEMKQLFRAFKERLDSFLDGELVSLDETCFCNIGNISYSYAKIGTLLTPRHVRKRKKVSVLMVVHPTQGMVSHISSSKPFCKETFLSFLKDGFIPSLPCGVKGVILDNVSFHKSKQVQELLSSHGIECLFIPPYSPRCNPIEEVFSLLKRHFRNQYLENDSFEEVVTDSLRHLNLFKDLTPYFNHTRKYVAEQCRSES